MYAVKTGRPTSYLNMQVKGSLNQLICLSGEYKPTVTLKGRTYTLGVSSLIGQHTEHLLHLMQAYSFDCQDSIPSTPPELDAGLQL
jgi:hypothetical protein